MGLTLPISFKTFYNIISENKWPSVNQITSPMEWHTNVVGVSGCQNFHQHGRWQVRSPHTHAHRQTRENISIVNARYAYNFSELLSITVMIIWNIVVASNLYIVVIELVKVHKMLILQSENRIVDFQIYLLYTYIYYEHILKYDIWIWMCIVPSNKYESNGDEYMCDSIILMLSRIHIFKKTFESYSRS